MKLIERHTEAEGRARRLHAQGFTFDMGASWYWMPDVIDHHFTGREPKVVAHQYWMPDVIDHYFTQFGKKASDYFRLKRLDPSYRVFWRVGEYWDIPAGVEACAEFFEKVEPGAHQKLQHSSYVRQKKSTE